MSTDNLTTNTNTVNVTTNTNTVNVSINNIIDPLEDQQNISIDNGHFHAANKKITNVEEAEEKNDVVVKKQLDLKLDTASFIISHALPGVPVLDQISIALIPALTTIRADSNDRIFAWIDPINNIAFEQTSDAKKPLLLRDSVKKKIYVRFDGVDDYLLKDVFNVSKVAGQHGNTCTIMLVVNTKKQQNLSPFQWGQGAIRFGAHIPWGSGVTLILSV